MNGSGAVPDDLDANADLALLAGINFLSFDPEDILGAVTRGAASFGGCRVEASYCAVDGGMRLCPASQTERPELVGLLQQSSWEGRVELPRGDWGWAFPLCHGDDMQGCMVIGARAHPTADHFLLLQLLAQKAGAALACAALHQREVRRVGQLAEANEILSGTVHRLQARTDKHELLEAAMSAGEGQQGIADALHRVTRRSVCVEDKFGNLCAWAGPGRPVSYPKPKAGQRDRFLRALTAQAGAMRIGDRVWVAIKPDVEILGVVALVDPDHDCDEDLLLTLTYCSNLLGLELSHQRNLAELQLNLRRDLVDDLVAGTHEDGAYARAEALGHDLRRPHYVAVIQTGRADHTDMVAAARAAAKLNFKYLAGRQGSLVVVLFDGHPPPDALHREVSRQLGKADCAIGIGSRCEVPADFPQSYLRARRALNVRLNSAQPQGASDYVELGFYHLVDAAHTAGVVDDYLRQWLGVLIDYDAAKNSDLVHTLSHYVESGGNYDESAAALHIHRSTLRYRLGRITELTGLDLRDVDTRFNLHAATRVWRFLRPNA
ncbi:PucR family transcriptional regulator [Mycobacterium paraterrae]|uniref:Helix-turn-helix domain-containing protein n=1 Tax=Mycobacterium paraterrae TaxID=577492 RepID=A0ABY3VPW4_9MYCO|nr:helix-turn-helix domain-containing protein [Mycobacterium paraterrae]UMB71198.1 helix-turn-helix domain-containing protein [Mycobacterium paraterrae]